MGNRLARAAGGGALRPGQHRRGRRVAHRSRPRGLRHRTGPLLPAGVRPGSSPLEDAVRRDPHPGRACDPVSLRSRCSGEGTTVEKAYLVILDTMLLVYFIPYIYLFTCYLVVRLKERRPARHASPRASLGGAHRLQRAGAHPLRNGHRHRAARRYRRALALQAQGDRGCRVLRRARRADLLARAPVRRLSLLLAAAALLLSPAGLAAQRAPVLQQVKVRHPYYYREMFIPQPTSGPGSAAWSPDGTELVYSMQGSLWRQRLGSVEARQVTDGPGYDYQPDWSPDGRTNRVCLVPQRRDRAPAAGCRDRRHHDASWRTAP